LTGSSNRIKISINSKLSRLYESYARNAISIDDLTCQDGESIMQVI
jgi:hypothetical protein